MDAEKSRIVIFFCQRIDPDQDVNRRAIEKEMGPAVKFFPLPCSGRIDPLHLLRALEAGADMVYLVTCGNGICRYREGNVRAKKRLAFAQGLLEEIGLERERLELVVSDGQPRTIDVVTRSLLARGVRIGRSPLGLK